MTSPLSVLMFVPTEQTEDPCVTCGAEQRRGDPRFLHSFSRSTKDVCSRCASCIVDLVDEFRMVANIDDMPTRHTMKRALEAHYEITRGGTVNAESGEAEIMPFGPLADVIAAQREAAYAANLAITPVAFTPPAPALAVEPAPSAPAAEPALAPAAPPPPESDKIADTALDAAPEVIAAAPEAEEPAPG